MTHHRVDISQIFTPCHTELVSGFPSESKNFE